MKKIMVLSLVAGLCCVSATNTMAVENCDLFWSAQENHHVDCIKSYQGADLFFSRSNGKELIGDFTHINITPLENENNLFRVIGERADGSMVKIDNVARGLNPLCFGGKEFLICSGFSPTVKQIQNPETIKRISIFLSNFIQAKMLNFARSELSLEQEVNFAITYDRYNNMSYLSAPNPTKECKDVGIQISGERVISNIFKFLDKTYTLDDLKSVGVFCYAKGLYQFPNTHKGIIYNVQIMRAIERENGEIMVTGWIRDDGNRATKGTFQALAKKAEGKSGRHNMLIEYIRPYFE